jgi:hypothetical protein
LVTVVACSDSDAGDPNRTGRLGGQVAMSGRSGPLRGAAVSIEQLTLDDASGAVREHVADLVTDEAGVFSAETGVLNGVFRVTARGGAYDDLATGATIELDETDEIQSVLWLDVFEERDDGLVSPVGHLTYVLAQRWLDEGRATNIGEALDLAAEHVHAHFGEVEDWGRLALADLTVPVTSPTAEVRGALVAGAWSYLAADIAAAAGASPQEVNVHSLMTAWGEDLAVGVFDGNDDNDRTSGSGLQVGVCPPVDAACAVPSDDCTAGFCRTLCDLYDGSPRVLLAGAMIKLIQSNDNLALDEAAARPIARAINENQDPELFGPAACVEQLDRLSPTIIWEEPPEDADPLVSGTFTVRVRAIDDGEMPPVVTWDGREDIDGDPTNDVAIATIDTAGINGLIEVTAIASDFAGNSTDVTRVFEADSAPPELTWSSEDFLVRTGPEVWWTPLTNPELSGTVVDAHDVTVEAEIAQVVYEATIDGTDWSIVLPKGTILTTGIEVTVRAFDEVGNEAEAIEKTLRSDPTPPVLTVCPSAAECRVLNELNDQIDFTGAHSTPIHVPYHTHTNVGITQLGADCDESPAPHVYKHAYLLDEAAPLYADESAKNELQWQFSLTDDGVGLDPTWTAYQVRQGGATLVPWQTLSGGPTFTIPLFRQASGVPWPAIPQLGTVDGLFEIDFRGMDAFGRDVSFTRCWNHHPLAAPIEVQPIVNATSNVIAGKYALADLKLNENDPIAAQVLNDGAPGAGLSEFTVWNGTGEDVYVTIDLTEVPTGATCTKSYQHSHALVDRGDVRDCGCEDDEPPYDPDCTGPLDIPECYSIANLPLPTSTVVNNYVDDTCPVTYSLRAWETTGTDSAHSPCSGCENTQTRKEYLLPRRSQFGGPRSFQFMIAAGTTDPETDEWSGTIASMRPAGSVIGDTPPYSEVASFTYIDEDPNPDTTTTATFTGRLHGTTKRCSSTPVTSSEPGGITRYTCQNVKTYRQYRFLGSRTSGAQNGISFEGPFAVDVAAAPARVLAPRSIETFADQFAPTWTAGRDDNFPTAIPSPGP